MNVGLSRALFRPSIFIRQFGMSQWVLDRSQVMRMLLAPAASVASAVFTSTVLVYGLSVTQEALASGALAAAVGASACHSWPKGEKGMVVVLKVTLDKENDVEVVGCQMLLVSNCGISCPIWNTLYGCIIFETWQQLSAIRIYSVILLGQGFI